MEYLVESFEHEGVTVEIYQDPDPMSPREWDNVGLMLCFHRSYDLGDRNDYDRDFFELMTWTDIESWAKEEHGATVVLPLYLMDHSSISMGVASFGDSWDSGVVGLLFDTRESRELMGVELDRFGRDGDQIARIREYLIGEVRVYDQYLQGDVYGYVVEDDSCWGFYGEEDAKNEGKAVAEWFARKHREERAQENANAIARTATLAWNGEDIDLSA